MKKLFVYGTLMNDEVLTVILKNTFSKTSAVLPNYKRLSVTAEHFPGIRPEAESQVEGVLIENLAQQHLMLLDEYEGELYQRKTVTVFTQENVEHHCETYVFKPGYYNLLSDTSWSNEDFRKNHMSLYIKNHISI